MSPSDRSAGAARDTPHRHAVVIGAGVAGLAAAAALRGHARVTLVERDTLPEVAEPRKGLPQARHAHLLWSGGARALEELLPGVTARWLAAGARRIALPTGLVSMQPSGWIRRFPELQFMIAASRDLLDWGIRRSLAEDPAVTVLEHSELLALEGDARRVTGVRLRVGPGEGAEERFLAADLVVDASGRGSRAVAQLAALGVPRAAEDEVDSGLVYASRIFRAPPGSEDFPVVNVQADAREARPGRTTTIVPIEGERWLVTLSGTRGGEPGPSPEGFEPFARTVRHPVVGEMIARAEPLTGVRVTRSTVNRRRFFERVAPWPDGFLVLGDAVATYNPVYGHGMSVAAEGALALRQLVDAEGLGTPGQARRAQRAVARPVSVAWDLATAQDILYPGSIGRPPGPSAKAARRYVDRLMRTATARPLVAKALLDVMTLSAPMTALIRPEVVFAVLRGPRLPPLTGPPLTDRELTTALGSGHH
ncbi:pyridine nucleotide-disulfide oxidoreductase [Streptomyces sp. SID4919]|uniref:FAD-dependent monooxygenase n=1 Tax=unclassified Streptomyces TaxID=2593676 RepID=UPI000823D92E|nr:MULTISPECIES: FAD-dependent monooxygenase [unclassified Streptomyces]MYY10226.1 pyridine nucleotide-disulfide oxidoreductase [Streptomyces sp. SID4919]SCK60914.1 2-polyprenyl-6-methoxyphenol hydroxylase [Streptomyces sp. AmelKG-E11A]